MPIYEYRCPACGVDFEKLVGANVVVSCPSCASARVVRRISLVGIKTGSSGVGESPAGGGCCGGGCGCH